MTAGNKLARDAVIQALVEITGRAADRINTGLTVQDLEIDSLDFVRVVQLTEDSAGVRLDDALVAEVQRMDDLIVLVQHAIDQIGEAAHQVK